MTEPLKFFARREEGGFVPLGSAGWTLAKRYALGEVASFQEIEEHDNDLRKWYFARVGELYANLPEHKRGEFPNENALRYWALCREGFCTIKKMACESRAEAERWASYLRQNMTRYTEISVIADHYRNGTTVVMLIPTSQAIAAMKPAIFKKSAKAVIERLEAELGIEHGSFEQHMRGSPAQQSRRP